MKNNLKNTCNYKMGFVNLKKNKMEKQTLIAQTVEHSDVYGNVKYYIAITNGDKTIIIKTGEKDFQRVKELETSSEENQNQEKLPFE